MKTGIVVNNYDPKFENRCQIRVHGLHTEKVDGNYVILDDDLPWATPAPSTSSVGASSVPSVGSTVYVDIIDKYNIVYYGQVEVKANVKRIMHDNADVSDKVKVIAFNEDSFDGETYSLKIYYIPEEGLKIECNGNSINMTKNDGMLIKSKGGAEIKIENDNTININTENNINLNCNKVYLSEDASERVILSSKLMEKFNTHTHLSMMGATSPPTIKIEQTDLSDKVFIK